LLLTIEKFRGPLVASKTVSEEKFNEATAALQDPNRSIVMPMTVAAWGRRPVQGG
jgi:hypothetical protein